MSRAAEAVAEFHRAFAVTGASEFKTRIFGRITLHIEEHGELEDALDDLKRSTAANRQERLEAVAGELADVLVVAYGTAELLGIDLDAAFEAVHGANMAKLPDCAYCQGTGEPQSINGPCPACDGTGKGKPVKRGDGKVLRPPRWVRADLSRAIR